VKNYAPRPVILQFGIRRLASHADYQTTGEFPEQRGCTQDRPPRERPITSDRPAELASQLSFGRRRFNGEFIPGDPALERHLDTGPVVPDAGFSDSGSRV
jgi:hypothetical protein